MRRRIDLAPKTALAVKLYRWWYILIGIGFLLLGVRAWIEGDVAWRIAIRFVIAVGFIVLGLLYFRPPTRRIS